MIKNFEDKKRKLQRDLDDLRAFEGNEKQIAKYENKLKEIELQEEFEDYKKNRRKIKLEILENEKLHRFIDDKGLNAEWNRYTVKRGK